MEKEQEQREKIRAGVVTDGPWIYQLELASFPAPWEKDVFFGELWRPPFEVLVSTDAAGVGGVGGRGLREVKEPGLTNWILDPLKGRRPELTVAQGIALIFLHFSVVGHGTWEGF